MWGLTSTCRAANQRWAKQLGVALLMSLQDYTIDDQGRRPYYETRKWITSFEWLIRECFMSFNFITTSQRVYYMDFEGDVASLTM